LALFDKGRGIIESLDSEHPDVPEYDIGLANAERHVASALYALRRYDEAASMTQQAKSRLSHVVNANLASPSLRRDLASVLCLLGSIRDKQGRSHDAVAALEMAKEYFLALAKEYPESTKCLGGLAECNSKLASVLHGPGDGARVLRLLEEAHQLREELVRLDPEFDRRKWDLARSWYHLGMWHTRFGSPEAALAAFERARSIFEKNAGNNSTWAKADLELAKTWFGISKILRLKMDCYQDGVFAFERGVEYRRRHIAQLEPNNSAMRDKLAREQARLITFQRQAPNNAPAPIGN
jgi:tetratricopeptide (TPR) repeat protein